MNRSLLQEQADRATEQRRELRRGDRETTPIPPGGRICPECGYVSHAPSDALSNLCAACYLQGERVEMEARP